MRTSAKTVYLPLALALVQIAASPMSVGQQDVKPTLAQSFKCSDRRVFVTEVDSTEKLIAVGCEGQVRLFDAATLKLYADFTPSPGLVIDLAFHPTESRLVSASYPKVLTLYDTETKEEIWQTQTPASPTRVTFSPDGSMIATGSVLAAAVVYDATTGRKTAVMKHELPASSSPVFSPDGRDLYVATMPRTGKPGNAKLVKCDSQTGEVLAVLGEHMSSKLDRLRLSPSGNTLASLDRDGVLKLWDRRTDQMIKEWKLDIKKARGLEYYDDGTLIVGGSDQILVVSSQEAEPVAVIKTEKGSNEIDAMPQNSSIITTINTTSYVYKINLPPKLIVKNAKAMQPANNAKNVNVAQKQKNLLDIGKHDNVPNGNAYFDGLVSVVSLRELAEAPTSMTMRSGVTVTDAKLKSLTFDPHRHGLKFIRYETRAGQTKNVKAIDVFDLEFNGVPYHLRYWGPEQQLFLINSKIESDLARKRLAQFRHFVRPLAQHADQLAATDRSKTFLKEAVGLLVDAGKFHIEESQSALIFTDLSPADASQMGKKLDLLESGLNDLFGIAKGRSIWVSKPIVAIFSTKSLLAAFEERVMKNLNHAGKESVRRTNERFLQTAIATEFDNIFARSMSWGYSLGYSQILHSNSNRYHWINSGIAHVVQSLTFPNRKGDQIRRATVLDHLRRHRSLVGILEATRLDDSMIPVCCELVAYLRGKDPIAFSQFFRDLKLGIEPDRALEQNYGVTQQELAFQFGRSLGVVGVVP